MDKLTYYRALVQDLLHEYTTYVKLNDKSQTEEIFDIARDRYQLVDLGWDDHRRIYNCILHIEIRNEKIWVEVDRTDDGFATRLVDKGVPKHDIVLAFHPKYKRPYTEFAVE